MNKRFLIPAIALSLMTLGFTGCKEDNMTGSEPLTAGMEFNFGAAVESNQTRTYYDPTDVSNPSATAWKICWNNGSMPLDQIYVYSPEAMEGRKQASYTVHPNTEDLYAPAPITKDGAVGVQTSDATTYNFYAMYPASAVTANSGNGNTLSATMPDHQTVTTDAVMSSNPVGTVQTTADMNCALMIAKNTNYQLTAENQGKVNLKFEPFASMLDITVNGTEDENTANNVRVTSVIIEANDPIAGDFTYDYSSESFTFGENASNSITIETMFDDSENSGGKVGVMMGKDSQLKVRAFMIPNPNVKEIKVKVVTSDSKTLTRTLQGTFKPKQIHFVKLPKITPDKLKLDYSIWLSQMDENIYISELSMPGSALSFNYLLSDEYMKTQTKTLEEQFNAGVRVFQCHVNLIDQTSPIDGGTTSIGIAASDGSSVKKDDGTSWTLGDVLNALQKEMSGTHKDEFCVLTVSDWIPAVTDQKVADLYERLNIVLKKAGEMGLAATGVNPNTTIGDIKGKVIVKLQLNGGRTSAWSKLNDANVWMNTYNSDAESKVFYSPMPFGTQPATNAGGTSENALGDGMSIIYSDCANPVKVSIMNVDYAQWRDGIQDNATGVLSAYAKNYTSDTHKIFSMTYLGGCGFYRSRRNNITILSVTQTLNKLWLNKSDKPTKQPWGWVMFNCVGTEETTNQGIQAVIEHNASKDFKLLRRTPTRAHTGDSKANKGVSIF